MDTEWIADIVGAEGKALSDSFAFGAGRLPDNQVKIQEDVSGG